MDNNRVTASLTTLFLFPFLLCAQSISIVADRATYLYQCGEPVTFTVEVLDANKQSASSGSLQVTLTNFGTQQLSRATFDLTKANPLTLTATLQEPGFLKCIAQATLNGKNLRRLSGVAYEPEKLTPGAARPADFDSYWDAAVARLEREVPLDPRVERMEQYCTDKREAYKVSFATFNNLRVYGFLAIPKGSGPFPVEVRIPGAGPGFVLPNIGMADSGFIHLRMNVHPFEPATTKEAQKKLYDRQNQRLKDQYHVARYCLAGATTRETYFFFPIMLGINRAVNWLATRPDIDKNRFGYWGSSQGGGFGFYMLGLNKHFTKGAIFVPAITDLLGFQKGRDSGWPQLIENMPQSDRAAGIAVAPYFDGAHFAPRISCPVRVTVGFIDETCPPCAVYAGYNALRTRDRDIVHAIDVGHTNPKAILNQVNTWLHQP